MNADRSGTLPAPNQHIEINVTAWSGTRFTVDYIARPQELRSAGLVTELMEGKILHQRSGIHMDEAGRRFKLRSLTRQIQPPKRGLWESGERVDLRYYNVSRRAVLDLPGVGALYPDGLPTEEERDRAIRENPGAGDRVCGSLSVQACAYAEAVGHVVSRARAVGRSQRLMRWSLINGTVIAPDWAWMIRSRLAGCAS
jgi:hypothetical protein